MNETLIEYLSSGVVFSPSKIDLRLVKLLSDNFFSAMLTAERLKANCFDLSSFDYFYYCRLFPPVLKKKDLFSAANSNLNYSVPANS